VRRAGFQVQRRQCATCIYRKASPLDLRKLEADVADRYLPGQFSRWRACHHAAAGNVCCAGFWRRHRDRCTAPDLQIAQRLNLVVFVTVDDQ